MTLSHDPLWPRAGDWTSSAEATDVTLLGVPAHLTSLSPTGAHTTPAAIRSALRRYSPALIRSPAGPPLELTSLRIADAGDIADPDSPEGEARTIARVRSLCARTELLIGLGGDNSLTYAVATGAEATGLITIDAHYDLRDGVSNGSPVRRLIEAGLDPHRIVQIGISDFANSAAYAQRAADLGITVITIDEVRSLGLAAVIARTHQVVGAAQVHLDVDVDVADRSVAPGCPASMPGGLAAWELRALVRGLAALPNVRSADIAEVDASADAPDGRTVRLAALCVLELIAAVGLRSVTAIASQQEGTA